MVKLELHNMQTDDYRCNSFSFLHYWFSSSSSSHLLQSLFGPGIFCKHMLNSLLTNYKKWVRWRTLTFTMRNVQASNAYLEFLCGPDFKILFKFVKAMPKHPTSLPIIDYSTISCTVLFTWIVQQLFSVSI